jgi:hypothetical protein
VSAKVAEIVIIAYIVSMKASIPLSSSGTRRVGKDRSPAETTAAVSKPGRMIEPALAALVAELGKRGLPPSAYRRLLRSLLMPLDRTIEPPKSSAARRDKRRRSVSAALDPEPNHGSCAAPAIEASAFAPGARAKAVLRGVEIAEADLRSSGGAYDLEQVQQLLHGVSRQRIDKRVREGSLLAVPGPSNKRRYPAVQFKDDGTVVDGLPDVLEALPTKNGFAILNFLVRPDRRLDGRRPIDLLEAGQVDLVVEAAQRMGEQGA